MSTSTILTVTDAETHDEVLAVWSVIAPGSEVERVDPALIRRLLPATALVVGDAAHARIARATGFGGAIIVVGTPGGATEESAFHAQGTRFVERPLTATLFADALDAAFPSLPNGSAAVRDSVARTRRLLAAGEIAMGLQHAFNNPLTALMAEVQLLQMEAPTEEVRTSATRMLDLVRRLTELSRSLDAVRDRSRPP